MQLTFDLQQAGYYEPSVCSLSYPFLPVPVLDATLRMAGGVAWTRAVLTHYGHCGQ